MTQRTAPGGRSLLSLAVPFSAVAVPTPAGWILVNMARVVRVRLAQEPEAETAGAQVA
jgi:hypothetical protein